jgi:hypothetical protein
MKRSLFFLALFAVLLSPALTNSVLANGDCLFTLFGDMQTDTDPENPSNEVLSIDPEFVGDFGGVSKTLPAGTQADEIDNQVQLKYYFVPPKTCTAGSPRVQLRIDGDGDGDGDFNAFGYVGHLPFGGGCVTGAWDFNDMTDAVGRWDLSQGGGGMTLNWDAMELFLAATYPNYQILSGSVVEDGYLGKTYYDNIVIGDCSLDDGGGVAVGPPATADQCKNGGWQTFNTPRAFKNQGDCIQFANTGK